MFSKQAIVYGLSAALVGYGLFSMHTAHIPGDLESNEYVNGKARYSYLNENGDKVQHGYYELTVPIVSAFERFSGTHPGAEVFKFTIDNGVGTPDASGEGQYYMGGATDESDCSTVGGTYLSTDSTCICFEDEGKTEPTGYIGKRCSIWTGLKPTCDQDSTVCTFTSKEAKNLMVFNTRRMVIVALVIIFASLVMSLLGVLFINFSSVSDRWGIMRQCLGVKSEETFTTTPGLILGSRVQFGFALVFSALIAIILSVVYVVLEGVNFSTSTDDGSDNSSSGGVYEGGSISGQCILLALLFSLVMANRFFVNGQSGTEAGDSTPYTRVTVCTSALGSFAAMLYCLSLYFSLSVHLRTVVQELVVATCVFLFAWTMVSLLSAAKSFYFDGPVQTFLQDISEPFARDPRAFIASFAFAVTTTLFVVMRKAQNTSANRASLSAPFTMYYQLGSLDNVCNYIGTEKHREMHDYGLYSTCRTKDGAAQWALHGVWIVALLFWITCTVVGDFNEMSTATKSFVATISTAAAAATQGGSKEKMVDGQGSMRPMRYSRIRVATSV